MIGTDMTDSMIGGPVMHNKVRGRSAPCILKIPSQDGTQP